MNNLIGLHFVYGRRTGVGEFFRRVKEAGKTIPVVKGLDEFSLCREAKEIFGDKVLTIGRINSVNGIDLQGFDFAVRQNIPPADLASWVFGLVEPIWRLHPYVDAWEITNEWSEYWSYQTNLAIEFVKLADQKGFRLGLYGFSTGNPPEYIYPEILRLCNYIFGNGNPAVDTKHFLSMHEYGGVSTSIYTLRGTEPNHALRHRLLYNFLFSQNPGINIPCVITEAGQNAGYEFIGINEFVSDFAWYNSKLNETPYVLGCAAWTLGNWYNANFQDALPALGDYIIALPSKPPIPPLPVPKPEPPLPPPPLPKDSSPSKAWKGPHMRADGHSRQADYDCISIAKLNAAKIMTNTDVATDMNRLNSVGIASDHILLRLFVSMINRPKYEVTPENFVSWMVGDIDTFILKGGYYIEIHNEPNLPQEGLGVQWMSAAEFNTWYLRVLSLLKARYGNRALFGFPGLSPQPNVAEWLIACNNSYLASDWVGAHAYWSRPEDWNNPEEGYYFTRYYRFNKPIIITEFSNKFSPLLPYDKGRAYAQYWDSLPVLAAFCFVSSASNPEFGWGAGGSGEVWVHESGLRTQIPEGVASWVTSSPTYAPVLMLNPLNYSPEALSYSISKQFPGIRSALANAKDQSSVKRALNLLYHPKR